MQLISLQEFNEQVLTSLWNSALGQQFPMRSALLRRNLFGDLNFVPEASFAAVVDGQLAGFVASKLNREFVGAIVPRMGYINSLIVAPDRQRQGIGTALLRAAVERLRGFGPTRIHLGRDTFHFFPGIPVELQGAQAFFAKHGAKLTGNRETDLLADLRTWELPSDVRATLEREAVEIRPCRPDEVGRLAQHLRLSFPGRWQYEFHKFIYDGGDPSDYLVVVEQERVIGFCHIFTPESAWIGPSTYWAPLFPGERFGGYGPLGVAKETRGRGLGLAVVGCAIAELKRRGITTCGVDWTGLVEFYGKLGFKPWKEYLSAEIE